jgi:hypothetical protein
LRNICDRDIVNNEKKVLKLKPITDVNNSEDQERKRKRLLEEAQQLDNLLNKHPTLLPLVQIYPKVAQFLPKLPKMTKALASTDIVEKVIASKYDFAKWVDSIIATITLPGLVNEMGIVLIENKPMDYINEFLKGPPEKQDDPEWNRKYLKYKHKYITLKNQMFF